MSHAYIEISNSLLNCWWDVVFVLLLLVADAEPAVVAEAVADMNGLVDWLLLRAQAVSNGFCGLDTALGGGDMIAPDDEVVPPLGRELPTGPDLLLFIVICELGEKGRCTFPPPFIVGWANEPEYVLAWCNPAVGRGLKYEFMRELEINSKQFRPY